MTRKNLNFLFFSLLALIAVSFFIWCRPVQLGGGNYYFIISSGSMEPVLGVGDWIVCSRTKFGDINVGEIIALKHPTKGYIVVHRVIEKGEGFVRTKGDACEDSDSFETSPENVLAIYTGFKIPKLGFLLVFSRTLPGLILIYYVPSAIVIAIQIRKLLGGRKHKPLEKAIHPEKETLPSSVCL